MKAPTRTDHGGLEIKMTPMIDVVFLLLVFFIWTSSFEEPEFDLPSGIAESKQATAQSDAAPQEQTEPFDEIVIRLQVNDGQMAIQVGAEPVANLEALRARLRKVAAIGVQPPVIVDPDPTVNMNLVVETYDTARAAGMDRVLFAAKAE